MKKRKSNRKPSKNLFFRNRKSVPFTKNNLPDEFTQFFEQVIWPKLKQLHRGYKLAEKKVLAAQVVHNLIEAGLTHKVVADSRDDHNKLAQKRIKIWDACIGAKLCRMCKGSQVTGKVTRYRATGKLLELQKLWELKLLEKLQLKRNTEETEPTRYALVVLYSGKIDWRGRTLPDEEQKKPISIKERVTQQVEWVKYNKPESAHKVSVEAGLDYFRQIENRINDINTENLSHTWIAQAISPETGNTVSFQPNVCLRQIHSGDFFRAMRLYSWGPLSGQGMTKEQRQTIEIDGERAIEIDSHCHAIRMLYHLKKIDRRDDIYYPERIFKRYYNFKNASEAKKAIVRNFVKKCTNICLNTGSRTEAEQAIGNALVNNAHYEFLKNLIFKTEKTNRHGILDRIVGAHPKKVSNDFFADVGSELMTTDGKIMLWILNEFVKERRKPALAIHDSLVVRHSDVNEAIEVFTESYHTFLQHEPVLKRKF